MGDAVREMLSTPEGRRKLAAAMTQPKRCGGMHWDEEGYLCYRNGERAEPPTRRP